MLELSVKVTPKARNPGIVGWDGDTLKVRISAPPDKGAANRELIQLLAKALGIRQSQIVLLSGATSRLKRLRLEGIEKISIP